MTTLLRPLKFGWLVASLVIFASAQSQAATYTFDVSVDGVFSSAVPFGTVDVSSAGVVTITMPSTYSLSEIAFNLNSGASVDAGSYTVSGPASYGSNSLYGPFNTVLDGAFGSSATFTVSNFSGIFNLTVNSQPIWFAAVLSDANSTGVVAADAPLPPPRSTPLPAAMPLFASGMGALGLLGWRRKRKVA
jgi:hypothetical protein